MRSVVFSKIGLKRDKSEATDEVNVKREGASENLSTSTLTFITSVACGSCHAACFMPGRIHPRNPVIHHKAFDTGPIFPYLEGLYFVGFFIKPDGIMTALYTRLGQILLLAALLIVLNANDTQAQQWQWPEKGENLQVMPEDTTPEQLQATMRGFVSALGVRCEYCHDDTNGNRLSQMDFAADTKETKDIARIMLEMVQGINGEALTQIGGDDNEARVSVTCMTCHRGVAIPRMLEDILAEEHAEAGVEAVITRYRELRERYYGGFSYNFGERTLLRLAEMLMADAAADVPAILDLNLEMFPESWKTHLYYGQLHARGGARDAAIASFEKAYERNPVPWIQQQLDQLKSQ